MFSLKKNSRLLDMVSIVSWFSNSDSFNLQLQFLRVEPVKVRVAVTGAWSDTVMFPMLGFLVWCISDAEKKR
ncbi:hypothetical protein GDO78_001457 [Eleutherodactylus coqui]|uniref:Uncharacterized protein n=1 Tax=Eleutherodactylus coqui TaxID=57060 RepID=A0A8J6FTR8_ELECQ|nr:hypothetical protein GDO78_001457 [Eleutherodactylus coqui]